MKTRVHVNQHAIRRNATREEGTEPEPAITVKTYKSNDYAFQAVIFCGCGCNSQAAKVVYSPDKPLSCGAKVWVETEGWVDRIEHVDPCLDTSDLDADDPGPCA